MALLTLTALFPLSARAAAEEELLQVCCEGETLTAFVSTGLSAPQLTCTISNQEASVLAAGSLADEDTLIKTTVLLDISTSMPSELRGVVLDAVGRLIEYKPENEALRLVLFGDEIVTLQDFSYDRYDLAAAAEEIAFDGQASRVYDAVYSTIPQLVSDSGAPTFYRTVVITDGVDDTATGITKEELYLALQDQRYPVDVIAVGGTGENKDLSAISRISCGRYQSLQGDTDPAALAQSLSVGSYGYLVAQVPQALLDGSVRQTDISDGTLQISADIKFPVFGAPAEDTPDTPAPPAEEPAEETSPSLPFLETYGIYLAIGGGALLLLLVILLAVSAARRKKRRQAPPPPPAELVPPRAGGPGTTEFFRDDGSGDMQYTIQLSDETQPGRVWTLPVQGEVMIGRAEYCPVRLDDRSVSREHCKITAADGALTLVHLSATNQTSLNGQDVTGSAPLQSGDSIKLGRERLHVDYIQVLGAPVAPAAQRQDGGKKTEAIF